MFINDSSWKKSEIFFRQLWYSASSNTEGVKCVCVCQYLDRYHGTHQMSPASASWQDMDEMTACVCVCVCVCICVFAVKPTFAHYSLSIGNKIYLDFLLSVSKLSLLITIPYTPTFSTFFPRYLRPCSFTSVINSVCFYLHENELKWLYIDHNNSCLKVLYSVR